MGTENSPDNSMHLAYQFVTHSYEWGLSRLDAVERRLQGLLIYMATITFVPPVAIITIADDLGSLGGFHSRAAWAFGVFAFATVLLIVARALGSYKMPQSETMFDQDYGRPPSEFMEVAISRASRDLKATMTIVARKSVVADIVSWLILVEAFLWFSAYLTLRQ